MCLRDYCRRQQLQAASTSTAQQFHGHKVSQFQLLVCVMDCVCVCVCVCVTCTYICMCVGIYRYSSMGGVCGCRGVSTVRRLRCCHSPGEPDSTSGTLHFNV